MAGQRPYAETCIIELALTTDADVFWWCRTPKASSVGFRDARVERLSAPPELNFLPGALSQPQTAVADEGERRGYHEQAIARPVGCFDGLQFFLSLKSLKIHSMVVFQLQRVGAWMWTRR